MEHMVILLWQIALIQWPAGQYPIDMQLLVKDCVYDKYSHTTMPRDIIFHRRYTIV